MPVIYPERDKNIVYTFMSERKPEEGWYIEAITRGGTVLRGEWPFASTGGPLIDFWRIVPRPMKDATPIRNVADTHLYIVHVSKAKTKEYEYVVTSSEVAERLCKTDHPQWNIVYTELK